MNYLKAFAIAFLVLSMKELSPASTSNPASRLYCVNKDKATQATACFGDSCMLSNVDNLEDFTYTVTVCKEYGFYVKKD